MIEIGKKQLLKIARVKSFGVYLQAEDDDASVLLPSKYVPEGKSVGDEVEVFVYRDSSDRMIATTNMPLLTLGEVGRLRVSETGKIGAFLDWGLEKDLFLPFAEQVGRPAKDQTCLAAVYLDKSHRLCATMKIYDYLSTESPYQKNDRVTGTIFQINERIGVFVAVDDKYLGMIGIRNYHGSYQVGDAVEARVVKVREDGKLELTLSESINEQMDKDAQTVLDLLESYDGVLPFTEKADPAVIDRELSMSKAAFKRAVGRLLKQKKIEISEGKIRARS